MNQSLIARAQHTPRVTVKDNRLYWEPSKTLRERGFKGQALGFISTNSLNVADQLNLSADEADKASRRQGVKASTVKQMTKAYMSSDEFLSLADRTKTDRIRFIKKIDDDFGSLPLVQLNTLTISRRYKEMAAHSLAEANNYMNAFKAICSWAMTEGLLLQNPCKGVRLKRDDERRRIATRDELWSLVHSAEALKLPSMANIILFCAGGMQRVCDVRRFKSKGLVDGRVTITQSKTKTTVRFALHHDLSQRIANAIDPDAFLFPSDVKPNQPYKTRTFNERFDRIRQHAAITKQSLIGKDRSVNDPNYLGTLQAGDMRRTGMVWAAEAGATIPQICSVSGHKIDDCMKILEHYLPRHQLLADQAINALNLFEQPSFDFPNKIREAV